MSVVGWWLVNVLKSNVVSPLCVFVCVFPLLISLPTLMALLVAVETISSIFLQRISVGDLARALFISRPRKKSDPVWWCLVLLPLYLPNALQWSDFEVGVIYLFNLPMTAIYCCWSISLLYRKEPFCMSRVWLRVSGYSVKGLTFQPGVFHLERRGGLIWL